LEVGSAAHDAALPARRGNGNEKEWRLEVLGHLRIVGGAEVGGNGNEKEWRLEELRCPHLETEDLVATATRRSGGWRRP